MYMRLYVYTSILLLIISTNLFGRLAPQAKELWIKSANGKYEAQVDTRKGTVKVYETGKRTKALWDVQFEYSVFYSKLSVSDSGNYIIHHSGHFGVNSLDDVAATVYMKDGTSKELKAKEIIDEQIEQRSSIKLKYKCLKVIKNLKADSFVVINAKDIEKKIAIAN